MNTNKLEALYQMQNLTSFLIERERLEVVQGPEQGLVGEIGGASELRRHLERKVEEAHARMNEEVDGPKDGPYDYWCGKAAALIDLQIWLSDTAEKRSDLSND